MAPRPSMTKFRQLLQEQQEPFELKDYLLEKNYWRNRESGFACSGGKLGSIKKFRKGFVELNRILRVSFKKLVSINKQKTLDLNGNGPRVAESERLSSACKTMAFRPFSGRDDEETQKSTRDHTISSTTNTSGAPDHRNLKVMQAAAGKKLVYRRMGQRKPSLTRERRRESRLDNGVALNKKVPEDSILSATLWDLLLYSAATEKTSSIGTAEFQELVTSNSAPQVLISKGSLHQTKQLLFDCVREAVEAHSKRGRELGSEEFGRLICDKMNSLQEGKEEANLSELLNSDYLDSVAEWRDLEPQKQLVGTEIGEIILKEITNEVVTELNDDL